MTRDKFDYLISKGKDADAARLFAKQYYDSGKMGYTRRHLIERLATRVDEADKVDGMTAKEVTLNYLKDFKKDIESTISAAREVGNNPVILRAKLITIASAIEIVEEIEEEQERKNRRFKMQKDIAKIAEHFGMKNQLSKLMEECGELIVASSKAQIEGIERHSRFSNLVEEIADVLLMIKQVMFLAGISDDSIEEVQRYKIDRTIRRYEIDKNCSNYEEDDVVILDENKVFKEFNTSTVNHPSHYNQGKYEVIDVIEDWKLCFHLGSSVKYIARAEHKGKQIEDLKKARWFLDRKIEKLEKGEDVE